MLSQSNTQDEEKNKEQIDRKKGNHHHLLTYLLPKESDKTHMMIFRHLE